MRFRAAAVASSMLLGACANIPGTSAYAIGHAEKATAAVMTDPPSAQFESVSIEGPAAMETACGEVRGKDREGRYGPFDRFVTLVGEGTPMIDQDGSGLTTSSASVPEAVFDAAWNEECATSPIPTYQQDDVTNMLDPAIGPTLSQATQAANLIDNE